MGTTRATKLLITTAVLLVAVAAAAQAPAAAPGSETSTGTGAPGPSTTVAGGPGPSAGEDCLTNLYNMSDCLTYVQEGSNLTAPDKACCPELAGLVESHPICLCQLLGTNTSSFGIQINLQKALKLPSVCAVETPPISMCSAVGYPVGVPMPSEAPSPPVGYPVGVPMPSGATSPPVGYPVGVPMPSGATSPPGGTSPEASTPTSGASGIANVSQLLGFAIACLTTALVF